MTRTTCCRLGIVVGILALTASWTEAGTLTCSSATTLETLVTCIRSQMPGSGSNGYRAPTPTELGAWRTVVQEMLQGSCGTTLPQSLAGIASRRLFVDIENGKPYCVLMEILDADNNGIVDRGWGTFIVDSSAVREVSHQAPHPLSDLSTDAQAIEIFKDSDSRSFLMAGTHRDASTAASTCQSAYRASDAAHNAATMYQAANEAALAFYGAADWWAVQWHGMAASSCSTVEVYISHGSTAAPVAGDKHLELKAALLSSHPAWLVAVPGSGVCSLNGTDNVLGRLLNGVPAANVCDTAASGYTGQFLHIEQDPNFRASADWLPAVRNAWPVGVPDPPTALAATAGNATGDTDVDGVSRRQCLQRLSQRLERRDLRASCDWRRRRLVHRSDSRERDEVLLRREGNERQRRERQFERGERHTPGAPGPCGAHEPDGDGRPKEDHAVLDRVTRGHELYGQAPHDERRLLFRDRQRRDGNHLHEQRIADGHDVLLLSSRLRTRRAQAQTRTRRARPRVERRTAAYAFASSAPWAWTFRIAAPM